MKMQFDLIIVLRNCIDLYLGFFIDSSSILL